VVTVTQCGCCFGPLLSLLAPLLAPLSVALVSAPNHSWAHLSAALHKNSLGGNVEEYFYGLWLVTVKLVYQGLIVSVKPERRDDIGMADPGEFVTLSGEAPDVILQGFPLLLLGRMMCPESCW
jgi:hypothetical protein